MVNAILKKALVFFIPIILIACESKSTGETRDVKREPKTIDLPQSRWSECSDSLTNYCIQLARV